MVGIINGFRWSILAGRTPLDVSALSVSGAVTLGAVAFGVWYFRRVERGFADVI